MPTVCDMFWGGGLLEFGLLWDRGMLQGSGVQASGCSVQSSPSLIPRNT